MPAPDASSAEPPHPRSRWALFGVGLCLLGAAVLRGADDLGLQTTTLWSGTGLCLAGCLLGFQQAQHGRLSLRRVLITAALMRLLLLPVEPTLSDDIYRYLWDGRVQWAGINPYLHAPDSDAVVFLRDATWERVNHRHVPTVYPPLAQWLFAAVVGVGGGVTALKAALVALEALLMWGVICLLRQRGLVAGRVVLYAWHPLPLIEIAGSGHIDALGVALLTASLAWLGAGRPWRAAAAFAGAILGKLIPILCLPVLWRQSQRGEGQRGEGQRGEGQRGEGRSHGIDPRPHRAWLLSLGVVAAACGIYLVDGAAVVAGLRTYALKWQFNDSVFALVYTAWKDPDLTWDDSALLAARIVCAVLWLAVLVRTLWGGTSRTGDAVQGCLTLLGAYMILSPTVHPWYLLWILPLLCVVPGLAWIAWSATILFAYEVLPGYRATGIWAPSAWALWVQYLPLFALLALDAANRWRQRARVERIPPRDV